MDAPHVELFLVDIQVLAHLLEILSEISCHWLLEQPVVVVDYGVGGVTSGNDLMGGSTCLS